MSMEIKIPSVGESVQEAVLAEWFKSDGEQVEIDEPLLVIETDKVTLEVVAEAAGVLKILVQEGETVTINVAQNDSDTESGLDLGSIGFYCRCTGHNRCYGNHN